MRSDLHDRAHGFRLRRLWLVVRIVFVVMYQGSTGDIHTWGKCCSGRHESSSFLFSELPPTAVERQQMESCYGRQAPHSVRHEKKRTLLSKRRTLAYPPSLFLGSLSQSRLRSDHILMKRKRRYAGYGRLSRHKGDDGFTRNKEYMV